jgi:acetylornithine deacetylase
MTTTSTTTNTQHHQPTDVIELHRAMVRFNTVNANVSGIKAPEAPLCAYLEKVAQSMGFTTRRLPMPNPADGDQLLITFQPSPQLPWLMFQSHMDVVSVEGMTIEPFAAEIKDNRIWGRGSSDTKGTGAAMLWAMLKYKTLPPTQQKFNVALVFGIDEEIGMTGVASLCRDHLHTLGFKPVGAIVGEPTGLNPITAHNGAVRWRFTTHGIACHSSNPSAGRSAISDMLRVIDAIESNYIPNLNQRHPMTGKAQGSVNLIRGGTQFNIIPAHCEVRMDRRVVPGEKREDVLAGILPILENAAKLRPGMKVQQEVLQYAPPLNDANNGRLLAHVERAFKTIGRNVKASGAAFATDAGTLDGAGVPCVVLGPSDISLAHTKDESIAIADLQAGVEAYLSLLLIDWQ